MDSSRTGSLSQIDGNHEQRTDACELSILMPCLDEAETLEICITKALNFLSEYGIEGEVLVADNGSTDGSPSIARKCGARVIDIPARGYGNALIGGIEGAYGKYVIMGDADDSYDFTALGPFIDKLREGNELVMGNRFRGGIEPGAMPPLHRYFGNPVLSAVGRLFFKTQVGDFHCGLRGFDRQAIRDLDLQAPGMELASEMVVKAQLNGLTIAEVPTTLSPDGRSRPPHLSSWSDGWRHLRYLLMSSPRWLFLYPGIFFFVLGTTILAWWAIAGTIRMGNIGLGINSMLCAVLLVILGVQLMYFAVLSKVFAVTTKLVPGTKWTDTVLQKVTLERGIAVGGLLCLLGIGGAIGALILWGDKSFGALVPGDTTRLVLPSVTLIIVGFQTIFSSFFLTIFRLGKEGE